jgi:hypothetical protein
MKGNRAQVIGVVTGFVKLFSDFGVAYIPVNAVLIFV